MKSKVFVSGLMIQFLLIACQKEQIPIAMDLDCSMVSYTNTIEPLIRKSCDGAGCHGITSENGYMLTYTKLQSYVADGSFKKGVLDNRTMPEDANLTSEELGQIKCWLDEGAPEN